ncbi:hypothetical protein NPIL_407811 [Nephila pilipes]|uniref:Uncharacterized protein n=1 Tax=Nephila pilipes TaxID=299642 RepID=A0A8X6NN50_NEPPI|nr:hypothetical protein NPIL_407811 [Nephila pilipes]
MIDRFSRWPEAVPTPNHLSRDIYFLNISIWMPFDNYSRSRLADAIVSVWRVLENTLATYQPIANEDDREIKSPLKVFRRGAHSEDVVTSYCTLRNPYSCQRRH